MAGEPDRQRCTGVGDLVEQGVAGQAAVEQDDHAGVQGSGQPGGVGALAGAVDRHEQQSASAGTCGADRCCVSAKQVEQGPQWSDTEPGSGVPQPSAGDLRDGQAVEGAGEFAPYREVAAFFEQRGGQQQADHDPGG